LVNWLVNFLTILLDGFLLLLIRILQSFDWLAAFHLKLRIASHFLHFCIAVSSVFLATAVNIVVEISRGLFFPDIQGCLPQTRLA
jgi:hypothetical protein